jgi:DNA polymerase
MSERTFRDEAASIARAARRLVERERALGGGELLAAGLAHARAGAEAAERARVPAFAPEPPVAAPLPTPAPRPEAPSPAAAAPPPAPAPTPTPAPSPSPAVVTPAEAKAFAFALEPPAPAPARTRARVEVMEPLPPFTDDLYPSALGGAREGLLAASLPVLNEVAAQARACTKCGLCETRTNAVPGVGSAATGIVFVGEAPGADEDAQGEPFVGRAGQLLTKMIAGMNERNLIPGVPLTRETVYICNVLKCRPPENRDPLPHEIESCSPYVMRQLEALQPRIICCLGKFAAELLLGIKGTISGMRGKTYRWRGAKLIVTYHPAYVLRSPNTAREPVWEDLRRLAQEYLTD